LDTTHVLKTMAVEARAVTPSASKIGFLCCWKRVKFRNIKPSNIVTHSFDLVQEKGSRQLL
jgi:hypothetical protein